MKQGTTPTLEFKLDINIDNVTKVYFTFTDELAYKGTSEDDTASYLLQKNYPDDATFEDDTFKLPLTQEETDLLTNTFYVEAQVVCGTAVVKSDIKKVNMPHTLWTTYVDDNESDGQSEVIHLSFSDNVIVEGGGSSNYNDLTNKPRINNIELIGNKTTSDLGLDIEVGDGLKRVGNVVSVDLLNGESVLGFDNGKLKSDLSAYYTKTEIDQMISADLKFEVVQTLPSTPDTHTIYLVPKSTSETNNVYDEYMYINNAWELIGSTEVDLSNYYTKTETYSQTEIDTALGNKQDTLTASGGIEINANNEISVRKNQPSGITNYISYYQGGLYIDTYSMGYDVAFRGNLTSDSYQNPLQPKLTAGTNITITDNVISASGGSYTFTDGLTESSGTVGIDLASGSKLLINANDKLDVDLSSKQDTIDSTHKLSSDLVDDTNTTNKFTNATEKQTWNGKQDAIDSSHKLDADNVDDTNSTNKFVPSHSSSDENKVLSVDSQGGLVWVTSSGGHKIVESQNDPPTTSSDYEVGDEWIKGGAEVFKCVAKNGTSLTWGNLSLNNYDDLAQMILGGNS